MTTGVRVPENAKLPEERQPKLQGKADRSPGLAGVFAGTQAQTSQLAEGLRVSGIACDSRKTAPGFAFFALHGAKEDGNQYVRDAVERTVDYATVNDRFFVNNVSLGVYAKIVQEESYRM